jgi:hypothetical protein
MATSSAAAASPRKRRSATSHNDCASSGSMGQFTALADARAGVNLEGATRLDIVLDELEPGERMYDATV